jgi:hypothetical protein
MGEVRTLPLLRSSDSPYGFFAPERRSKALTLASKIDYSHEHLAGLQRSQSRWRVPSALRVAQKPSSSTTFRLNSSEASSQVKIPTRPHLPVACKSAAQGRPDEGILRALPKPGLRSKSPSPGNCYGCGLGFS